MPRNLKDLIDFKIHQVEIGRSTYKRVTLKYSDKYLGSVDLKPNYDYSYFIYDIDVGNFSNYFSLDDIDLELLVIRHMRELGVEVTPVKKKLEDY